MKLFSRKRRGSAISAHSSQQLICMHVQGVARIDPRVMREATTLVEAGFRVAIVDIESEAGRPGTEGMQSVQLRHIIMPNWYVSSRFPWSLLKAAQMFMRSTLLLLGTKADIYHAHDVPALPATFIASRLRRKPLIFDAHELPLEEMPVAEMSINRRFIHPLLARVFERLLPGCVGVIATSSPMAREIANRYRYPGVSVVRNFPPYQRVQSSDRLRRYLNIGPEMRIALYQGNIQPDRQLDRLVRAAAFLQGNTVIALMGKADTSALAELHALIENEGVSERVKIIPPVPYAELLDWTASADVGLCILPVGYTRHLDVCLPNKLFEYAMAGLPVLASSLDAITEVVRAYELGRILPSLEPADIGAAINAMLADTAALARMRANGLAIARQEFCWEKERPRLLDIYRLVLALPEEDSQYRLPQAPSYPETQVERLPEKDLTV